MARGRNTKQTKEPVSRDDKTEVTLSLFVSAEEKAELSNAWTAYTRSRGPELNLVLDSKSTLYSSTENGDKTVYKDYKNFPENQAKLGDMLVKYFNLARRQELSTARRRYKKRRQAWGLI